jgi:hypothetical protein
MKSCCHNGKPELTGDGRVVFSNGVLELTAVVPGAPGTYCGTRFAWGGIVDSVRFQGRHIFGPWRSGSFPLDEHDNVTGTAGEFAPLGYEASAPGGCFVKIGVGVLRRPDAAPYSFAGRYELVEAPPWQVEKGADWIEARQIIAHGRYGYEYVSRVALVPGEAAFVTRHTLANTGAAEIHQTHYSHNFIVFDGHPVGPDYEALFPFESTSSFAPDSLAFLDGRSLKFRAPIPAGKAVFSPLTGFGGMPADNQVAVRCHPAGLELRIGGDRPVTRFHFFAAPGAVCPEPFVELRLAPDQTETWEHRYEFCPIELRQRANDDFAKTKKDR